MENDLVRCQGFRLGNEKRTLVDVIVGDLLATALVFAATLLLVLKLWPVTFKSVISSKYLRA